MPYISPLKRPSLDLLIEPLLDSIDSEGEANYVITRLVTESHCFRPLRYGVINTVMGLLDCVAKEYYYRVGGLYEEIKRAENGDVKGFKELAQEVYEYVDVDRASDRRDGDGSRGMGSQCTLFQTRPVSSHGQDH